MCQSTWHPQEEDVSVLIYFFAHSMYDNVLVVVWCVSMDRTTVMLTDQICKRVCLAQKAKGGCTLIFSLYIGSDPASTIHPQKISGISSTPKKIFEILATPKNIPNLCIDLKKRP